jgi:hypothetical protein
MNLHVQIGATYKKKYAVRLLALSLTVLAMVLLAVTVFKFSTDVVVDKTVAMELLNAREDFIKPEPVERRAFFLLVFSLPLLLVVSYHVSKRAVAMLPDGLFHKLLKPLDLLVGISILILSYLWLCSDNYFLAMGSTNVLSLMVVALMTCGFYLTAIKTKVHSTKVANYIFVSIEMIIMLLVLASTVFNLRAVTDDVMYIVHFNAIFHAMSQVFLGKELLVDLPHQYGLYPHILEPIFRITGLSVLTFTLLMGVLCIATFWSILKVLKALTFDRGIACLGVITLFYYSYIFRMSQNPDPYFQYYPIRTVFPALSIYLVYRYFKERSKACSALLSVLGSVALLWNFETGFVVFAAWLMLLVIDRVSRREYAAIPRDISAGLFILILVVSLFSAALYFRYGHLPDYGSFFMFQRIFYNYGFFMLPMEPFHPWNLVALIYVMGLLHTIEALYSRNDSVKARVVAYLSLLGIGLFAYYQGRSHNEVLLLVSWPAAMLLTIFMDALLASIKSHGRLIEKFLFAGVLGLVFFSLVSLPKGFQATYPGKNGIAARMRSLTSNETTPVMGRIDMVKRRIVKGEEVLILSYLSGLYYLESETTNPLRLPGPVEMLLKSDYRMTADYLEKRCPTLVIDRVFLESELKEDGAIQNILRRKFAGIAVSPDSQLLIFRRVTQ